MEPGPVEHGEGCLERFPAFGSAMIRCMAPTALGTSMWIMVEPYSFSASMTFGL